MLLKYAARPTALAAAFALAVSSTAFGQTMVGGQEVSDEDLPMVTQHCEMLAGEPATDAMGTEGMTTEGMAPETGAGTGTEGGMAAEGPTGTDMPAEGETMDEAAVDIDAITIEECQAAGLVSM